MKAVKSKKGFTLVEIIIVVAVIAVLTGILVPTFINLNRKANQAKDNSLVANLNTTLKMAEGASGKANETMHETVEVLKAYGYDISVINATSGEDIVWYQNDNQFYLSDKLPGGAKNHELWHIQDNPTTQTYSIYASPKWTAEDVVVTAVGFDAGSNATISSIKYNGSQGGQTVRIRTLSGKLTVDAEHDTVWHYGKAGKVKINAVDPTHSYHVSAEVAGDIEVDKGHVVFENKEYEYNLKPTSEEVTVENKAEALVQVYADPELNLDPAKYQGVNVSEEAVKPADSLLSPETFDGENGLSALIDKVNNGEIENPVITLPSPSYSFTKTLKLEKSVTIKGIPGITKLTGFYNPNQLLDDVCAFKIVPTVADQVINLSGMSISGFAIFRSANNLIDTNKVVVSCLDSDAHISTITSLTDIDFHDCGCMQVRLRGGEYWVENCLFDGSTQSYDAPNVLQINGNPWDNAHKETKAHITNCIISYVGRIGDPDFDPMGLLASANSQIWIEGCLFEMCEYPVYIYSTSASHPYPNLMSWENNTFVNCGDEAWADIGIASVEDLPEGAEWSESDGCYVLVTEFSNYTLTCYYYIVG